MKKNKKLLALVCCMALLVVSAGATLAWLATQTQAITNTFTVGDINITLDEVKVSADGYGEVVMDDNGNEVRIPSGQSNSYKLIPGNTYVKDPKVTVLGGSEACYVFIKVEKTANYDNFLTSVVDTSKWTTLEGVSGVYYLEQESLVGKTAAEHYVLAGNTVTVNSNVTKTDLNNLKEADYPNIKFTAYAVQKANMSSAKDAWTKAGF